MSKRILIILTVSILLSGCVSSEPVSVPTETEEHISEKGVGAGGSGHGPVKTDSEITKGEEN